MMFLALFSSFFRWLWLCRVRALKSVAVAVAFAVAVAVAAGAVAVSFQLMPIAVLPDENVRSFDQMGLTL